MAAWRENLSGAVSPPGVVIVGRGSLQNRLLAGLINERLGCCVEVSEVQRIKAFVPPAGAIALLDIDGMRPVDVDRHVRTLLENASYSGIAFINADQGGVAELVGSHGVQGVFFLDASKENLVKGLQALFAGEYWLPRVVLSEHFARTRRQYRPATASAAAAVLTRKETETLELLLEGHSNAAIARRLRVSPHTVKTHLYNLFRKIGARNRVQAVNWAMQGVERPRRELE